MQLDVPAELTVSMFTAEGVLLRRLVSGQMTRPSSDGITHLFWDGLDASGIPVADGRYTITAEARVGGQRRKSSADIVIMP